MENNKSEDEMFLMSKYKYIKNLLKSVNQTASVNFNSNNTNPTNILQNQVITPIVPIVPIVLNKEDDKSRKKAEAELSAKLKEEKKKKMAEMCKPGTKNDNKTKFVEKEKYVDDTPFGEKKGKFKY